jgi:DNA-binding NarL/FixJ family response regulator
MTASARAMPESTSVQGGGAMDTLSPAEREVAVLAAAGLTNLAIAKYRGKAVRTIANQMASILSKLGLGSRYELAARLASLEGRRF